MPANEYVREYLQYGGQAIIEGVMMRSPRFFSVACRAPNGEIIVQTEALEKTWVGRQKWLKLPFLRGSLAILDSMGLGTRAMRFASKIQMDEARQPLAEGAVVVPAKPEPPQTSYGAKEAKAGERIQDTVIGAALFGGVAIGLVIFVLLPNAIGEQVSRFVGKNWVFTNLASELIKIVFFLGYMLLIGQMPEIAKVFQYHGAEHKAINTLEALQDLDIENCKKQTRLHPRCGTSFAIIVLLLGLVVFTFVPRYPIPNLPMILNILVRVAVELVILPIIAGVAYELLRIAGRFRDKTIINFFFFPGLMTQYLTTREPNEAQIEVALTALKGVIEAEKELAGGKTDDVVVIPVGT